MAPSAGTARSSIAVRLAFLVGASVLIAALLAVIGDRADVPAWTTIPVSIGVALALTYRLARAITTPLREMTVAAARMAAGDHEVRVATSAHDEVGQLATAFNSMAADLGRTDEQRRRLIATVSHELRTPLAAQQALLENLADGVVQPSDAALEAALSQSRRLGTLVADLLDLSRLDAGAAPLRLTRVDVPDLVAAAVAEARLAADVRQLRIDTDVEPAVAAQADAARVAQVLANLLDNAVRHSPPGTTVRVRAGAAPAASGTWYLEVSDEGPGLPDALLDRGFQWFSPTTGGGTGLGLAIAEWVCRLHGGTLRAVATDRPGATVRAELPLHPTAAAAPARTQPQETTMTPTPLPSMPPTSTAGATPSVPAPVGAPPVGAPASVVDSMFGDLWPERGVAPQQLALLGSLGIGVVAGLVVPFRGVGVGLLLVMLAAGALVLRHMSAPRTRWMTFGVLVSLALGSMIVVRAAEWVTVLSLFVVGVLVATTLTGARTVLAMVGSGVAWVLSGIRGLPLLGRTLSATSRVRVLWPVLRTVAFSGLALVVFGGLFASADPVLGRWAEALVPHLTLDDWVARAFAGFLVGGVVLAACYLALNPPRVDRLRGPAARPVTRTWEWVAPIGTVIAMFVAYLAAQATVLFAGDDYVLSETGMTYAQYARAGFGQLTVATALTLATMALAVRKAPRSTGRERTVLVLVIGVLGVLALVVVASALHRMNLYQQAYGFTVLRVLVDGFELWLGLLIAFVLVATVRQSWAWVPRAGLATAAVFVLVLGLANPEAWVAQRNIERYQSTGKLDSGYLSQLGPDATPTILSGLPNGVGACIVAAGRTPQPDDLLGWNLGRARAASARAESATALQSALQPPCTPVEITTTTR